MLELSEYKEFCKHYCEILSKELGVTFDEISEEQMERQFNANRFEGFDEITGEDFKAKTFYDYRLAKYEAAIDELEGIEYN